MIIYSGNTHFWNACAVDDWTLYTGWTKQGGTSRFHENTEWSCIHLSDFRKRSWGQSSGKDPAQSSRQKSGRPVAGRELEICWSHFDGSYSGLSSQGAAGGVPEISTTIWRDYSDLHLLKTVHNVLICEAEAYPEIFFWQGLEVSLMPTWSLGDMGKEKKKLAY